jgi:4-amino-4-deoxy-L-arabinose transferase-like glycosyltransferase
MSRGLGLGLMVLCLLVAAFLRLPDLTDSPPGPHFDEAANGILAAEIGRGEQRPLFITSYTGKEALYFYLAGGLMRLTGESLFSLRLASAFLGLLTVAATYWLGRELLADRRVALLAAALLAVSFWHLLFSRLGFRAISQPLLQALAVAALFRGLRRSSWPWLAVAGLALGLTAYTYLAARLFPIPLFLAALPLIAGPNRRQHLRHLGLTALVALATLTPLLLFFVANPETFWVRIGQVGPAESPLRAYADGYVRSLAMFFLRGDPYWRFNLPLRPLLDWFWGGMFLIGWVFVVARWFRMPTGRLRSALLLLALVPLLMILPTALAVGEILPSNLRAIGLLPFIYFLPSMGLVITLQALYPPLQRVAGWLPGSRDMLSRLARSSAGLGLWGVLVALVLTAGAAFTAKTYFRQWAPQSELFYASDGDLAALARYLDGHDRPGETIFVAALHYRHPTVAFLSDAYNEVKWLPESQALVLPAEGSALYLFPRSSPLPGWARSFLPAEPAVEGPNGPDGRPAFVGYRLAQPAASAAAARIARPVQENFDHLVTVLGYEVGPAAAGQELPLTFIWRVEARPEGQYMPFVHLVDLWGFRWSQAEPFAYPAEQWTPGDVVIQRVDLPLVTGMPPGEYRLRLGFYDPEQGRQLARLDEEGRFAGSSLAIDGVEIASAPPPTPLPSPPQRLDIAAGPRLTLMGYERGQMEADAGAHFWLALWWLAEAPLDPMVVRLEIIRPDDTGLILLNGQPVHGSYPFDRWATPQLVIDHRRPNVPAEAAPGDYRLLLRLLNAADKTITTAELGTLTVLPSRRTFEVPRSTYPLAADFGGEIALRGYDLESMEGRQLRLELVWQAMAAPGADYTVFVHVLDQNGRCCLWQADNWPVQGAYPTGGWLPGEVVVDEYLIDLTAEAAPGRYPLEIGLYLAENGQRLRVEMPGIRPADALLLQPVTINEDDD